MYKHECRDDRNYLRQVIFDGYCLRTWDTGGRCKTGQYLIGYEMVTPDGHVLFTGEDCGVSPMHCIDSDDALRGLIGFLTLQPGDTDDEYFANYTAEQRAFAAGEAEQLQTWGMEPQADDRSRCRGS